MFNPRAITFVVCTKANPSLPVGFAQFVRLGEDAGAMLHFEDVFSDCSITTGREVPIYIHSSVPTSLSVSQYFQVSDITSRLVMSLNTAIV
jgi:hypothetical protein